MNRERQKRERGSALIEFCLSSLLWLPLLLGTWLFGSTLIQAIQVAQLSRDSGHMFARGVDFTNPQNAALLGRLSTVLTTSPGTYAGAIVLSEIRLVNSTDCAAANMKVCPNDGKYVFIKLFMFGNTSYAQTRLGNPGLNWLQNGNDIQPTSYLSDPALVATNFSTYLTFSPAYASEVTLAAPSIGWAQFNNTESYARTFF
jgi:hypothetical protein